LSSGHGVCGRSVACIGTHAVSRGLRRNRCCELGSSSGMCEPCELFQKNASSHAADGTVSRAGRRDLECLFVKLKDRVRNYADAHVAASVKTGMHVIPRSIVQQSLPQAAWLASIKCTVAGMIATAGCCRKMLVIEAAAATIQNVLVEGWLSLQRVTGQ
jgi:hypothetical protein